jgi:hypothetical protein
MAIFANGQWEQGSVSVLEDLVYSTKAQPGRFGISWKRKAVCFSHLPLRRRCKMMA